VKVYHSGIQKQVNVHNEKGEGGEEKKGKRGVDKREMRSMYLNYVC